MSELPEYSRDRLGYERSRVSVGIVHFGFGNFHRAHQASYLHRLLNLGGSHEWGICGVGILPDDVRMRDAMAAQDCLFTVIERHPDGSLKADVVGSVVEYCFAPDDPERVLARLADASVRVVSLTVTEGGYLRDPATGRFDPNHVDVAHDAANPRAPATAFGYIVEGLRRWRSRGLPPFTVMSCDNLQGNSDAARDAVVGIARRSDPEFASWIEAHVAFPNSMVDRITPVTTDADREVLARDFGLVDRWPVPCEPFTQWILEDDFPSGRPDLGAVGVQLVDDVRPYEFMKLRLLNASHQAIAYLGAPQGYVFVDEAMRDPAIRGFLEAYMQREARPTLGHLPGVDVDAYVDMILERFANPFIRDTMVRLATDGTNRMATFTIPVIRDNLDAGRPIDFGVTMVAAWAEYWSWCAEEHRAAALLPADRYRDTLILAATDPDPGAFARNPALVGDLAEHDDFRTAFIESRTRLAREGMSATVVKLLNSHARDPQGSSANDE